MRRVRRIVGWFFLTLLLIFLGICTAGEIRQRVLVHRATALLSDIHSVRLHQSNWNDAQRLRTRWGRWGHYDGSCTADDCLYVITLDNLTVPENNNIAEWRSRSAYFLSAFRLLPRQWGGGLRQMQAMFLVEDGVIVRSGLLIDMTQSPFAKGAQPVCCGSELILSVRSQASLDSAGFWQEERQSRHPDYTTWRPGGCTFCLMGRVTYADGIPPEEAARLSAFQLSCATRWSSCLTLEDLDPAAHAWHLYETPWGDPPLDKANSQQDPTGCSLPLYALGRDAKQVVSVEALDDGSRLGKDADGVEHESSRVRVIAGVKGVSPWAANSIYSLTSSGSPYNDTMRKPLHLERTQRYFLMLDNESDFSKDRIAVANCGIVRQDAASAQEVERGIAMDDELKSFEPTVSLEGFARHKPELWDR